jgi:hypothetical protein
MVQMKLALIRLFHMEMIAFCVCTNGLKQNNKTRCIVNCFGGCLGIRPHRINGFDGPMPPPKKSHRFEPTTLHYPTIDPQKSKIRTRDHALHHHWPPKVKGFEPTTMHYATIDPKKSNIRTHDHALHHHWPPKSHILLRYWTTSKSQLKLIGLTWWVEGPCFLH